MTFYPIEQLPIVSPMMVRRFNFKTLAFPAKGGLACLKQLECEDVGEAKYRLEYDEPIVDCSFAILNLTNAIILTNSDAQKQQPGLIMHVAYFNGRRWRSHRDGKNLTWPEDTLLYIGNPVRIEAGPDGLTVHRSDEFEIRSGMALQSEMENAL